MAIDEISTKPFLVRNKISDYKLEQIKSDASFREYYRVENKRLLIMHAPREKGESLINFEKINKILSSINLSVSKIYDIDYENNLMLIEDFGNDIFSKILNPNNERDLYQKSIELLSFIHNHSNLETYHVEKYSFEILINESELFIEWYLEKHLKLIVSSSEKVEFRNILEKHFKSLSLEKNTLVLRDFHVDNLIYLENRNGIKQLGLIDYQDALLGSVAYDLASLVEDVRRPIKEELKHSLIEIYSKSIFVDQNELQREIDFYSIQRNLKIIGIFSRLKYRDNKMNYFPMIEVAWSFINNHIKKSEYNDLNHWIDKMMKKTS
tara:strand:+ start:1250 stop:2218 length:969 start_codon:yes stop_codon:yes gene_type:complete